MAIDKVLIKIQAQITDLVNNLEDFVQPSVQPSVQECEQLKFQLAHLQDLLAVYTHLKHDKELSPSFNIHSKVSNTEPEVNIVKNNASEIVEPTENMHVEHKTVEKGPSTEDKVLVSKSSETNNTVGTKLTVGINDKFRITNELFKQNTNEYNIAIEQFNSISNINDAETFMASLAELYNWNEKSETVKFFYTLVRNKYK